MENKEPDDDLFDRLNVSKTNCEKSLSLYIYLGKKAHHCIDVWEGF